MEKTTAPPKLFLSYSWTSPEHEARVVRLAAELSEVGVDVVFDKWDLKEGQEANAFMEKMVTDPEIKKVAMLCDAKYKLKADGRKGGVGTESQIISKEVYETQEQTKFVAVVFEKDTEGRAIVPAFYSSRIYIDLSEDDRYTEEFERLVRWVYDKPLYQRPTLGEPPSYLVDSAATSSGTAVLARRAISEIKGNRPSARIALEEYFFEVAKNLERFRVDLTTGDGEADDKIVASIEEMLPLRNELVSVFQTIAGYGRGPEFAEAIHGLFEKLASYKERPDATASWTTWSADNFSFFIHELFLYALAVNLSNRRFDICAVLLGQNYHLEGAASVGRRQMVPFNYFRSGIESLKGRNQRLKLGRESLQADILKKRAEHSGIRFNELMQADFIAYIRSVNDGFHWWPVTLLYAVIHYSGAFEFFARSESKTFFDKFRVVLGFEKPIDFVDKLKALEANGDLPKWNWERLDVRTLSNWENLVSKP